MIHDFESLLLKNDISKRSDAFKEVYRKYKKQIIEPILREYLMLSDSTILPKTTAEAWRYLINQILILGLNKY